MEYQLEDLIDIPLFQTLQDRLNEIYSFPSAIIDNEGNILTATAWQDLCTKFHRVHPECEKDCRASDQYILSHLSEARPAVTYRCPHGLVDNATPIIIAGMHLGNYFTGQFFTEPPDLEFFRAQAHRYGFDEDAYLDAVRRVPIWSTAKLTQYLEFIKGFVEVLAGIGHKNLQEVEARRQIQERDSALEETHIFHQQIIDSLEEGLVVYGNDLRYRVWNPYMERLSGVAARDAIGRHPLEVFPFLRDVDMMGRLTEALSGKAQRSVDFPFTLPDGRSGWASDTSAPLLGRNGAIVGVIATVHDITERKLHEATLARMQKIESLGTLAGGIAHDFNNVLTGVLGNLSLLAHDRGGASGTHAELIHEAMDACGTARGLAQQLLTFASGGQPIVSVVDLVPLLRDAAGFAARGSSARCVFDFGDEPLPVSVDKEQFAQVVQNLILNAVQAMPRGGVITLQAAVCDLADGDIPTLAAGPYVRVAVRDDGDGIPEANLRRIFDPYFTTKTSGRGLGLAMCHSIVTRHGGHLAAESRPGAGSVLTICLPAASRADIVAETDAAPLPSRPIHVLVMDDDDQVSRVLKRMLERLGHQVETVTDGARAVEAYRTAMASGQPYDAVIMDLTIAGGMGGHETLRKLQEVDARVTAIVSSGYSNDPIMSECKRFGFAAVLPKPYRVADVARAVGEAVTGAAPGVPKVLTSSPDARR